MSRLQQISRLVTTVHARIGRSEALNAWHETFHATTEGLLRAILHERIPEDTIDAEIKITVFAIEGLLTHNLASEEQRTICRQLAARW